MKFIHTADVHLDSPLRGLENYAGAPVEAIRGAPRRALANVVDLACERRVDFLLIAGDLYDGDWTDFNTGLCFVREMARLADAKIPVFIVRGNHDAESQITKSLRLPINVHVFASDTPETRILENLGVAIHGQSFAKRAEYANIAANYPAPLPGLFNIGMLHTALSGFADHEPYAPCEKQQLISAGYGYWALGHVHQRTIVCDRPWIVFPGNLQGRHMREVGEKGCTMVETEGEVIRSADHVAVDTVRFAQIRICAAKEDTADDLLEKIQQEFIEELNNAGGRILAARVTLNGAGVSQGSVAVHPDRFIEEVRAQALTAGQGTIWIERVVLDPSCEDLGANSDALCSELTTISRRLDAGACDTEIGGRIRKDLESMMVKLPIDLREQLRAETDDLSRQGQRLLTARLAERGSSL